MACGPLFTGHFTAHKRHHYSETKTEAAAELTRLYAESCKQMDLCATANAPEAFFVMDTHFHYPQKLISEAFE